jgi:hypothetical protein
MPNQYLRFFDIQLSNASSGLSLSGLRCTFKIRMTDSETPNQAEIRVYNLNKETVGKIRNTFTQINIIAGYAENHSLIFSGAIKQTRVGDENDTDTFIDIYAGDGQYQYNFATVSATMAAGVKKKDVAKKIAKSFELDGFDLETDDDDIQLPRGKVLHGAAKDKMRKTAADLKATWSIQQGRLLVLGNKRSLPSTAVLISAATGLVGTPEEISEGVKIRTLLNPNLKIGGLLKLVSPVLADPSQEISLVAPDGQYRVYTIDITGDTHGNDWYSDITALTIDPITTRVQRGNLKPLPE